MSSWALANQCKICWFWYQISICYSFECGSRVCTVKGNGMTSQFIQWKTQTWEQTSGFPYFFFWKLGFQLGGIIESSQGRSQLLVVSGWFSTKEYTCSFLCCSKGWKRGDLGESYVCWRQQRGPRPVVWCTVHTVSCQKPCLLRTCLCMAISNTDAASQLVFCLPPSQQLVHFTHLRIMCNSHVFHQLFMFVVFPQHFCKNLDSSWIVSTQVY